jgi:hypothetical protein
VKTGKSLLVDQFTGSKYSTVTTILVRASRHSLVDVGLYAISAIFIVQIVRSTARGYNTVRERVRYLCVRLLTLSG